MNRSDGIDPLEPLAALGIEDITGVQPVSGGMDTLIWRVETPRGAFALRLFRPDQQGQCLNEVQAMQIVNTLGVPVPKVTAHGMWGDRPVMLMKWCDGSNVLEAVLDQPDLSGPIGESMGRLHADESPNRVGECDR